MINTAIKGVLAHKLRLALTALAIVMGVAFVAGTYVFTDTINARFSTLFSDVYAGIDATVRPPKADFGQEQASLDPALLDTIRGTDGVAVAAPAVGARAQRLPHRRQQRARPGSRR
jgi:putative ABC transport system permease protein